ncbi:PREDICTED: protein EMSY-LIKE 2-like isoform X2 [Tarenaya hassleriana]|uniref:protein EMSY-LIKE 2-like isoform X2 n=1 Tax=Tarenaya hassleriana TaxID=28532 RepID=UPI00053C543E|nr:PREDICTED: protein EMSY-LIKE 2-like isoform X2 [Tarenaya hassleriana]
MEERQDPCPDPTNESKSKKKREAAEGKPDSELDRSGYKKRRKERMEILRNRTATIREMQRQAYFVVLRAFAAESEQVSSRMTTLKDLMRELNVTFQLHKHYEKVIGNDQMLQQLRIDSSEVEEEEEKPQQEEMMTSRDKHEENAMPSAPGIRPASSERWSRISPESLIGRVVYVRMPEDDDYIQFTVSDYDADKEQHLLQSNSNTMEDPSSWFDLRQIPSQDIMWEGEDPGISGEACSLKPGQTILRETSTTLCESYDDHLFKIPPLPSKYTASKGPLEEVSEVTSKDPDKPEKGKGILKG